MIWATTACIAQIEIDFSAPTIAYHPTVSDLCSSLDSRKLVNLPISLTRRPLVSQHEDFINTRFGVCTSVLIRIWWTCKCNMHLYGIRLRYKQPLI